MIRLTTPTHKFGLPISPDTLEKIKVIYAQNDKIVLTKEKTDMSFEDNKVFVPLTQEETKMFNARFLVQIQMRALTYNGKALASKIFTHP